ncbi:MAG: TIGR02281 family clan AA aspartic protease [Pseudomonadota bacterium]
MRGGYALAVFLGLIAITLVVLLAFGRDGEVFGLDADTFANMSYLAIVGLLVASAFTFRGQRLGNLVRDAAIWGGIILVLVAGYAFKDEVSKVWQQAYAGLVPGSPVSLDNGTVRILRNSRDDFTVKARVNDAPVDFIFDTGASAVVLTFDDARRAGYLPERMAFTVSVQTANGRTTASPVTIDSLSVGSIERRNIPGLVARENDLTVSLLGRTFLDELSSFTVGGDTLELRD